MRFLTDILKKTSLSKLTFKVDNFSISTDGKDVWIRIDDKTYNNYDKRFELLDVFVNSMLEQYRSKFAWKTPFTLWKLKNTMM